jgi:phage shock protein E
VTRRILALIAVLVLALTACSSGDGGDTSGNGATLGVDAFSARANGDGVVVLDVRTPAEFAVGHLADAVNIDVESRDFGDRIAELDKDATYAVYCRSGNRSAVAMKAMLDAGFTDVAHLDGGITDWMASGGEVVTD